MDDKLQAFYHRSQTTFVQVEKYLPQAKSDAVKLFDHVEAWLSESGAEYCLGAESTYSLADVLLTCMVERCMINAKFFEQEITNKRPNILRWWQMAKKRPSHEVARLGLPAPTKLTTCTHSLVFLFLSFFIGTIIFLIVHFSSKPRGGRHHNAVVVPATYFGIVGCVLLFFATLLTIVGLCGRSRLAAIMERAEAQQALKSAITAEPD